MRNDLDLLVARLARVDDAAVASSLSTDARDRLLADIAESGATPARGRRRVWWRRPIVVLSTLGALAASTAFAVVNLGGPAPQDLPQTECLFRPGESLGIPATSGDPLADCAAVYRQQIGPDVPPLRAWGKNHMVVVVAPATRDLSSDGMTPLPAAFRQNTSIIQLTEALDDYVAGLNAGCLSSAEATEATSKLLTAFGFGGWKVTVRAPGADGVSSCANTSIVDSAKRAVEIVPGTGRPVPDQDLTSMVVAAKKVMASCETLPVATAAMHEALAALAGNKPPQGAPFFNAIATDGAACTKVYLGDGGSYFVTLRGPSR